MNETAALPTPPVSTPDTPPAVVSSFTITGVVWMPTSPPRPAPDVMTIDDVVIFLRLGKGGRRTVQHYVNEGELHAARIGKPLKFRLCDVQAFVEKRFAKKK